MATNKWARVINYRSMMSLEAQQEHFNWRRQQRREGANAIRLEADKSFDRLACHCRCSLTFDYATESFLSRETSNVVEGVMRALQKSSTRPFPRRAKNRWNPIKRYKEMIYYRQPRYNTAWIHWNKNKSIRAQKGFSGLWAGSTLRGVDLLELLY